MEAEKLQRLTDILFLAKVHYRLWEELMKKRDQKSVDLVNNGYATFFEYTRHAHFKAIFVELHKLIETRQDTVNLRSLFNQIPADHELGLTVSSYQKETAQIQRDIFIIRNEVEAHSSAKYTPETSFEKVSITSHDIETFIVSTGTVLNKIGSEFFQHQSALSEIEEQSSVDRLFDAISKYEQSH